jgi:hypothetical protein
MRGHDHVREIRERVDAIGLALQDIEAGAG